MYIAFKNNCEGSQLSLDYVSELENSYDKCLSYRQSVDQKINKIISCCNPILYIAKGKTWNWNACVFPNKMFKFWHKTYYTSVYHSYVKYVLLNFLWYERIYPIFLVDQFRSIPWMDRNFVDFSKITT